MKQTALALLFGSALAASAPAAATVTVFTATLNGSQVNPPTASTATGSATVTVDDVLQTLSVSLLFSGLAAPATASHIHCCAPPGTNALVATQTPTFVGFPATTSGNYDHTFDMTDVASWNSAFITAHGGSTTSAFADLLAGMLAGNSYINIHDSIYPAGEISGQLHQLPEPATWLMMLFGFAGVGLSLRVQRTGRKLGVVRAI
jgi:hypothetical protein